MLEEYTDIEAEAGRCEPTASGFVQESVIRAVKHNGERVYSRQVFLAIVRDGRIAEITMYCTGDWDEATVARQAAEAPMLRS
jgi:ketosteroid isomerase-like protein